MYVKYGNVYWYTPKAQTLFYPKKKQIANYKFELPEQQKICNQKLNKSAKTCCRNLNILRNDPTFIIVRSIQFHTFTSKSSYNFTGAYPHPKTSLFVG